MAIEDYIDTQRSLVRIDERVKSIQETLTSTVSQDEFRPVRAIVYGMVALILTAIVLAGIGLVVISR